MLSYILSLVIGLVAGFAIREAISQRRRRRFRNHQIRDRFAQNKINDEFIITLKQTPSVAPKVDVKAANGGAHPSRPNRKGRRVQPAFSSHNEKYLGCCECFALPAPSEEADICVRPP